MQANVVDTLDAFEAGDPGTVLILQRGDIVLVRCPRCGEALELTIADGEYQDCNWNGDRAAPSLNPIKHEDCGFRGGLWQGYFTDAG